MFKTVFIKKVFTTRSEIPDKSDADLREESLRPE